MKCTTILVWLGTTPPETTVGDESGDSTILIGSQSNFSGVKIVNIGCTV